MQVNNRILYIIGGANGSGKSTLADVLLKEKKLSYLNADEIAKEIAPKAMNTVSITAGKVYFQRLDEFLKEGKSFAVESTLSGNNMSKVIRRAKENIYKVVLVYSFLQNCTTCIERVKKRVESGGHNVPEEDIIRRYYKSIVNFWNKYRYIVDEWAMFYNGKNYDPQIVSHGEKDKVDVVDKEMQNKFIKIFKFAKEEISEK